MAKKYLNRSHKDIELRNNMQTNPWFMFIMVDDKQYFYPITPSDKCKPEDHAKLNPKVFRIENLDGEILWEK